ncbi:vacuolar protein sorting/targeting protein 10 [Roridomyces roridus]|uniref:Vacuolar protein sorting/targeting protein 10 n=1 Tax=Roridomyces roridus TaxID=1738132 RepID=A0AAD7BK39_9AGAR|nr:vacuolar protein sorting/targeting protein 10 [Roridomyces roridus]
MPQRLPAIIFFLLWLPLLLFAQKPEHTISSFENLPSRLFFFDDTSSAIYHDSMEGNIFVSPDEGKTWKRADDIPKGAALMVIEHPFDNTWAFVLTRTNTHYRTDDRGRTWRTFEVPIDVALVARPLSFHSDPKKSGYILYQGTVCDRSGWGAICHDETYMTEDAFASKPRKLLSETTRCQFAHSSADFKHEAHPDLIYCVAFDTETTGSSGHSLVSSRLFSSTDFFQSEKRAEDLGIGKNAKGVIAFAIVSKFAVVALKDLSPGSQGDMLLYVTVDTKTWAKAQFPHASSAKLRENAYTLVESTTHSLAVDVVMQDQGTIGTLFVSNSNGTFFVQSLKDTNRNEMGFVDYERIYGVEGIGLANVVANAADVARRGVAKILKSFITFNDGSSWSPLRAPEKDSAGNRISCDPEDADKCSLHLHSVTTPHNSGRIFSSPAPGFVMGVGSVGPTLMPYAECDTFLSTDGGVSWNKVSLDAYKYDFGDSGSILVVVKDEDGVSEARYSLDSGYTWTTYDFGIKLRARALVTVPDSTSQKFMLLGQVALKDQKDGVGRFVIVYLDFIGTRNRKCTDDDFEKWYARSHKSECIMGHKQWYKRRKPNADCYVGDKFTDPVGQEENCACTDDDYECDYNFLWEGDKCVPVGPEPIPADVCKSPDHKYMGSSGYRKIPGNTCTGGNKDDKIEKPCSQAPPAEGAIIHQTFPFPITDRKFQTILVRLKDGSIWQSSNEGYTWVQIHPELKFVASGRAYLITETSVFYTTTDSGRTWNIAHAPTPPNTFRAQVLRFHPDSDKLVWTGNRDCDEVMARSCRAEAQYSRDNGRTWNFVENYVVNCAWAKDVKLDADPTGILCESYRDKLGSQKFFMGNNPLGLVEGSSYFMKKRQLFKQVVGFAKFSEFLVVAELLPESRSLDLQVSLDGVKFATGMFPPSMHPTAHASATLHYAAYTVLESSTGSLFLHMTMSEPPHPYWGNILKSNSNGTYFGLSIENVNRDDRGFVDFERMIGLKGIALANVVVNPDDAAVSGVKQLQTRITHNDGGVWTSLMQPHVDSYGTTYTCNTVSCVLNLHGLTSYRQKSLSTPSIVGVLVAAGNVGNYLAPYDQSDTFFSRDGGFTWEEIRKGPHLWVFGDSGSVLVMASDREATDHVFFSTDEGSNWGEYQFTDEKMRVTSLVNAPSDTSRRFILFGHLPHSTTTLAVHLDFTYLTSRKCIINIKDPGHDDFEFWIPSEERQEECLFGRKTLYHRRVRYADCVVGDRPKYLPRIEKNCSCVRSDFECEFNYYKNDNGECVLSPGLTPLPSDRSCRNGSWYERTAYRKISYSSCQGGERLDLGARYRCADSSDPDEGASAFWFLVTVLGILSFLVVAYGFYVWKARG